MLTRSNEGLTKVIISDAAKSLGVPEESIEILVKFHRIATQKVGDDLIVDDGDVCYFYKYIATYGKLPNLPVKI